MLSDTENASFTPAPEFIIEDLETLKVAADPLRLQLIEQMFEQPRTVKQLAEALDTAPSKLYYHINLLEQHGLIQVVSTRIVSGIVEKSYRTAARWIRVRPGLLSPYSLKGAEDNATLLAEAILDETKRDIRQQTRLGQIDHSGDDPTMGLLISRVMGRLSPEAAMEFRRELKALAERFEASTTDDHADDQAYMLVLSVYPTARGRLDFGSGT